MKRGVTMVEVLIVVGITAILVSLLLAAVMRSREAVRRLTCSQNLRQVALAIQNYASAHRRFPNGNGDGFSFQVRLLPYLEETARFRSIDFKRAYEEQLGESWTHTPRVYICPSDPATTSSANLWACNYLGVSGGGPESRENGVIISSGGKARHSVTPAAITDGLSNTLALTEAGTWFQHRSVESPSRLTATYKTDTSYSLPDQLDAFASDCFSSTPKPLSAYGLGTNWIEESTGVTRLICIFPKQPRNCANAGALDTALLAPNSLHAAGIYCGLADGSVRLVSQEIDTALWQGLATRDGGEIVAIPDTSR